MEYRRRRARRGIAVRRRTARGEGSGASRAVLVLILTAAVVYIICASAAGTWLAEEVIAPAFSAIDDVLEWKPQSGAPNGSEPQSNAAQGGALQIDTQGGALQPTTSGGTVNEQPSQETSALSGGKLTSRLSLPALNSYMLQMGVYSQRANADAQAEQLRARGAGGYVIEDGGRYRVIASAYADRTSLDSVREQLKTEDIETAIYEVAVGGAAFNVTAEQSKLDAIEQGFSALSELREELYSLALEYDRQKLTPAAGRARAAEIYSKLDAAHETLLAQSASGDVIDAVSQCYIDTLSSLNGLSGYETESYVDFSSKIKYTQIEATQLYAALMQKLG